MNEILQKISEAEARARSIVAAAEKASNDLLEEARSDTRRLAEKEKAEAKAEADEILRNSVKEARARRDEALNTLTETAQNDHDKEEAIGKAIDLVKRQLLTFH